MGVSALAVLANIEDLKKEINNLLLIKSISKTIGEVAPNAMTNITFDVPSVEGYKPLIAFYQVNTMSSIILPSSTSAVVNSGKATFSVRSLNNIVMKNVDFYSIVLYVKEV